MGDCVNVRGDHAASPGVLADILDHTAVLTMMYAVDVADHDRRGSWRRIAEVIGYGDAAMWCRASKGAKLSRRAENELRLLLGIAPKGQPNLDYWTPRTVRRYMAGRRPYNWS